MTKQELRKVLVIMLKDIKNLEQALYSIDVSRQLGEGLMEHLPHVYVDADKFILAFPPLMAALWIDDSLEGVGWRFSQRPTKTDRKHEAP